MEIKTLNKIAFYALCAFMAIGATLESMDIDILTDYILLFMVVIYLSYALYRICRKGETWLSVLAIFNMDELGRIVLGAALMVVAAVHGMVSHGFGSELWMTGVVGLLLMLQGVVMKARASRKGAADLSDDE